MEHNFMMSPAGRENFFNKWWQVVGSIQKTNDLDVHIALLSAPSYASEIKNKYYSRTKTPHQIIREHIDMFGESCSYVCVTEHNLTRQLV